MEDNVGENFPYQWKKKEAYINSACYSTFDFRQKAGPSCRRLLKTSIPGKNINHQFVVYEADADAQAVTSALATETTNVGMLLVGIETKTEDV